MSRSDMDTPNMALFCDFENVALGVREARYDHFDINRILERLLLKGSIVVKKAYCDWDRYKDFKGAMHQASFELIEIPHVRMSGKNSADIAARWTADRLGEPVTIGDVTIRTGDFLLGDRDGVIVIPSELAEQVIAQTEQVATTENQVRDAIRSGIDPVDAYLKYGKF